MLDLNSPISIVSEPKIWIGMYISKTKIGNFISVLMESIVIPNQNSNRLKIIHWITKFMDHWNKSQLSNYYDSPTIITRTKRKNSQKLQSSKNLTNFLKQITLEILWPWIPTMISKAIRMKKMMMRRVAIVYLIPVWQAGQPVQIRLQVV